MSILGDKRLVPKKSADLYRHHDRSHNPLLRMRARGIDLVKGLLATKSKHIQWVCLISHDVMAASYFLRCYRPAMKNQE